MQYEGEQRTRKERIDPRLHSAGWDITEPCDFEHAIRLSHAAVKELPTLNGPADYALSDDGKVLGVAEAKKVTLGPQGVLAQAERYSRGIKQLPLYQNKFAVPFLYSTNGTGIWFHDVRNPLNRSREISAFHTPAALKEMLTRNLDQELAALGQLAANRYLRPYQREANEAIEEAIRERKRRLLLTMATGTGKTVTLVNEVYRLMKAGIARRVLFLVDRRALAAQAVRTFASFEAEPGLKFDKLFELYSQRFFREDLEGADFDPTVIPTNYLTNPKLGQAFVYVSTIQRMAINLFGRDAIGWSEDGPEVEADKLDIPIHAFDLIVADECHRGYSSKVVSVWRNTLEHFDALKIGLTATPASHTTGYFENVVYRYDTDQAVAEGYLVPYDVVAVNSDVRMHGVFLKEGEAVEEVDPMTGVKQLDLIEDERAFDTTKIEREITAPDANRKVLTELKRYADEYEATYGRFPKILIFADNDMPHTSHADQLVNLAREIFGRGEGFVGKITGRVDRPLQRIREFRNRPTPAIVVTVDLMTTGIDIPDLEYLVFLRPVKSRILFTQMLGRGTRKGDKYADKSHFTVFDCFDGTLLAYFRNATDLTADPPESDGKTIVEVIDDIWENRDRDYSIRRLVRRLRRIEKEMSGEGREMFAGFILDGDMGRFAEELPGKLHANFTETMKLLREKRFQELMTKYPKPGRSFLVALGVHDTVSSQWLIRAGIGKEYKPADYLKLFAEYVRQNSDRLQALSILFSHPEAWGAQPLRELRQTLATAPDHFTEDNLRRAYNLTSDQAMADLISMVKRAKSDTWPLLSAEERVKIAIDRVFGEKPLTASQKGWIEHIRQHLIANLSIDRDDFDNVPVLTNRGGWAPANKTFDGHLSEVLARLNKEMVAA